MADMSGQQEGNLSTLPTAPPQADPYAEAGLVP
jgi:hypothetical protein